MTAFAVERLNWQRVYGAYVRRPGSSVLAVCAAESAARTLAARHESAARRAVNPFAEFPAYPCGSPGDSIPYLGRHRNPYSAIDFGETELVERLRALGAEPPAGADGERDWAGWYAAASPRWSAERLATVCELFTKMRFYRVVERPVAPSVFAVLRTRWTYQRPPIPATDVQGGELVALHRTRRAAEADAAARAAEFVLWQGETGHDVAFDMGERQVPGFEFYQLAPQPPRYPGETEPGAVHARDAVPFEVCEVPCEPGVDLESAELVLATRTGFTMPVGTYPALVADPLVPARLFASATAAEAWCEAREAEDRCEFPFAWYGEVPDSLYNPHGFAEVRPTVEALLDLWGLPPVAWAPDKPYLFDLDLRQWWYDYGHRVTPEQNAAVWAECWGPTRWFVSVRHVRLVG